MLGCTEDPEVEILKEQRRISIEVHFIALSIYERFQDLSNLLLNFKFYNNNKIQDIAIKNDLDFKNRKIKTPIFNSIDIHQKNR